MDAANNSDRVVLPDGTLVLDRPVVLPPILDMLVVGGGPFGTAAAFRASELGLSALVIDYDDLMKRIRDYAKDKLILPDFGGGDKMQFPEGGPLLDALRFGPIDKDAMCVNWKALYRRHGVPAQVGVEMTGLDREGDLWRVIAWNHNTKAEQTYVARSVVLAFGRGVPRRLDIPGSTEGLAFGLTEASRYVGEPVCVIGGGTSAAEAVVAISNAKALANDVSTVFWSYRGDRMPKVSKALAPVFFDAFVNGNVRYLPKSDPVAIVEADGEWHLSLRIDRRALPGRPVETVLLEFKKHYCIACIGEDIPEALLGDLGIPLVTGGPSNKKRIVVSPLLETRQPNVFLAGDVLSPAYFETDDFDADPGTFREIKRRGNIKAAMRDGVLVAEVVKQKVDGKTQISVQIDFLPDLEEAGGPGVVAPPAGAPAVSPSGVPAAAPQAAAAGGVNSFDETRPPIGRRPVAAAAPKFVLVTLLPTGVEANEYNLRAGTNATIGRQGADICFPEDTSLSDRHATIVGGTNGFQVRDEGSAQGVFLQPLAGRNVELARGAIVRAGRQWLVVAEERGAPAVAHYDASGKAVARYPIREGTTVFGRQSPDVTLDAGDGTLSRRHLAVVRKDGRTWLRDLNSANGTLLKVNRPTALEDGDVIIVGQQSLRFSSDAQPTPAARVDFDNTATARSQHPGDATVLSGMRRRAPGAERPPAAAPVAASAPSAATAPVSPVVRPTAPAAVPAAPPGKPGAGAAAAGATPAAGGSGDGPSVRFKGHPNPVPCEKGKTICDVAEAAGIHLAADCHQGSCGMDPVRILSGQEHLNAAGSREKDTLEDLCSLEPGVHRLACMARVSGPIAVELLKN